MTRPIGRLLISLLLFAPACGGDSPNKPKPASPIPTKSALSIHTPARGAMIRQGTVSNSSVTVSGTAMDSINTITSLVVDGQSVAVSGADHEVAFSVQKQSRWGLSLLSGETTNSGGGRGEVAQSFLRSLHYFPPSASVNVDARVPDGYVVRLRQEVLDDGSRTDVDDLATGVQRVLAAQNWNALFPTCPLNSGAGPNCIAETADIGCGETNYAVRKNGTFAVSSISVDVDLTGGATPRLTERVRIVRPILPIQVTGAFETSEILLCVPFQESVTGSITADEVVMTFTHELGVGPGGGIELKNLSVATQWTNARVDVDFGVLSFLGGVVSFIATTSLDLFQNQFADMVGDAMAQLIPFMFEEVSTPSEVELPATVGSAIRIGSVFSTAAVAADHVSLGMATQFYPETPVKNLSATPYGALRKDGAPATFPASGYTFGVGAKDDAVNQFLWAAWAGGAFDFGAIPNDACFTSSIGTIVSVEAMLPPVIMPGTDGHDLDVGFGDLVVVVDLAPGFATGGPPVPGAGGGIVPPRATLHVSWLGGASLDLDPATNQLLPGLDSAPEVVVQVAQAVGAVDASFWRETVVAAVQCEYTSRIEAVLGAFPVPEIDIGFVPGMTPGTKLGLSSGVLERTGDYSVLTGGVVQTD